MPFWPLCCADVRTRQWCPKRGDFSFALPDGYSVSNVTDKTCSILRDEDSTVVGGVEITQLEYDDLTDDDAKDIMLYLQRDFHMTNDIEFIASNWGNKHPIVCVTLKRHGDDGEERNFSHTFFERDSGVYHMWFDMDAMDPEIESEFLTITGVD